MNVINKRMQQTIYLLLLGFSVGMINAPTYAQAVVSDVDGSTDLDFLDRYRDSGIVRYEQSNSSDFLFALARVRKSNNIWRAESERRVYGAHTSVTYRAPDRVLSQSVFEYFRTQIDAAGFANNFVCSGRSCGNSNKWANVIYDEKRLYGPDINQHYLVASKGHETLAVYVIKRGNKRVYARIDHVVAPAKDARATAQRDWSEELQSSGRVNVPADTDSLQEYSAEFSQLVDWLRSSGRTLHVVGHAYGKGELSELKSRSLDSAVSLRLRLIELGAEAARIEVHGIGPLAPRGNASAQAAPDRLELLLID